MFALPHLRLHTRPHHPPPPTRPPPIDSIHVITEVEKNHLKNQGHIQIASRISYEILAI